MGWIPPGILSPGAARCHFRGCSSVSGLVPGQPLRLALRVGDEVIIDAPADLRAGAPIVVAR